MGKIRRKNKIKQKKQAPKSRKELRKEKRLQKKESKRNFFSQKRKPNKTTEVVKQTEIDRAPENESEIESDFEFSDEEIQSQFNKVSSNKKVKKPAVEMDRFQENQKREIKKQNELEKKMRKRRIEQLKAANEEDDKIIRKLEKKLKIDKHKKENSVHKMFDDGLNYALELCLPKNIENMYTAAKEAAEIENSDDDFQEDLNNALGLSAKGKGAQFNSSSSKKNTKLKKIESKYIQDETDLSGSDSEFQNSDDEDAESEEGGKDSENSEFDVIDKNGEQSEDDLNSELSAEESKELESQHSDKSEDAEDMGNVEIAGQNTEYEDIYGRKRDKEGNVVNTTGKYIPPHIRAKIEGIENVDEKRKQKLQQLRRHCKGFLNRVSEANMHRITSDIENLYMNNSRFDMNNTLSGLITEALISNVLSKERMVLEYAMIIAILHANVGSEIGAHFLQFLVTKFITLIKNIEALEVENKELDNVVFVLSHLYSFKIFQHTLIFEIINQLLSNLCEKSVECLLLVLRSIGFQLRKDDPGGLKELIITVQKKANESPLEIKENPRLKFMLDVLNAIKNNNVNKIPQYDPSLVEHLKKILKSMLANGKYIATLNITLDDLLKADERGKWWVVGSAWSGNINDIGAAKQSNKSKNEKEKFSEKLLALARVQKMNTEDRRNVFCIIMGSEDYIDAFERLLHLAIKDHRVIASIIIHCCLSENKFNPYYSVLAQKFCEYDRKYQLAVQFSLWDRIKDIHSLNKMQISNLAQFLIYLIVNGGLPISVLKVVEFAELDKPTLKLVRQVILGILLGKEEDCIQVFQRIAPSTKLNMFKDSIRLFMHHFLLKGGTKTSVIRDQLSLLKSRISIVDRTISFIDSRVDLYSWQIILCRRCDLRWVGNLDYLEQMFWFVFIRANSDSISTHRQAGDSFRDPYLILYDHLEENVTD